ncbi:MAG: HD domain-containing protein [Clostridia bacterium]|nr:HD domain-containing protein [Clostridia bacterium]
MNREKFEKFIKDNEKTIANFAFDAYRVHNEVNQSYDGQPYFTHFSNVAHTVQQYASDICLKEDDILPIMFGAYFHDSIEDARLTYNDVMKIAKKYMDDRQSTIAVEIVYALTNEKGRTRKERANDKYYEGIRNTPYAPLVKLADRYANMHYSYENKSRMIDVYNKELKEFLYNIVWEDASQRYQLPKDLVNEIKKFKL